MMWAPSSCRALAGEVPGSAVPWPQPAEVETGPPVSGRGPGIAFSDRCQEPVRTSYRKCLSVIVVGASGSFWWLRSR